MKGRARGGDGRFIHRKADPISRRRKETMPVTREIQQTWPAPPLNLWTQAFADMLVGKWVQWQDGEEGGWGTAIAAQVLDGGEQLLVTIEYDETTTNPPF